MERIGGLVERMGGASGKDGRNKWKEWEEQMTRIGGTVDRMG